MWIFQLKLYSTVDWASAPLKLIHSMLFPTFTNTGFLNKVVKTTEDKSLRNRTAVVFTIAHHVPEQLLVQTVHK